MRRRTGRHQDPHELGGPGRLAAALLPSPPACYGCAMLLYEKTSPLIALHIPKCGGTSFGHLLASWFPEPQLLLHYRQAGPPPRHELEGPVCVYGHFNSARGVGVEEYYPQAKQFITIVREPFDRFLSQWFYLRPQMPEKMTFDAWIHCRGEDQLQRRNEYSFIWHIPYVREKPIDKIFADHFVFIGTMERYRDSVAGIAAALNKPVINVPHLNVSARTADHRGWRPFFDKHFGDELEAYEKACQHCDAMIKANQKFPSPRQ